MKRIVLILLAITFSALSFAQGDQIEIWTKKSATDSQHALLHLPDDYYTSPAGKRYPIIVFFPGIGEGVGNDLSLIYNHNVAGGPAYEIAQGHSMHFVNPVTGITEKFIVVSVQSTEQGGTTSAQVSYILADLIAKYPKIDIGRITLTCISQGGHPTSEYVGGTAGSTAYNIAAYIPMSAALTAWMSQSQANYMFSKGTAIWGFGGKNTADPPVWDVHGANTGQLVYLYNLNSGAQGRMTEYINEPAHWGWNRFMTPEYREWFPNTGRPGGGDNLSIYTWALLQGTPTEAIPFSLFAGVDRTIQAPPDTVHLSATAIAASGKTITGYAWNKVSGPGSTTILNPNNQTVIASGLQAGTYVFRVVATQSDASTLEDTLQVTVTQATVNYKIIKIKRPLIIIKTN